MRIHFSKLYILTISLLVCFSFSGFSQNEKYTFLMPLDIPPFLSANFGELRPNHFHAGLDFKTQAVVGKNILAIDTGYVSRVQVRPTGYGVALYITHPNGYTSVYGHILSLEPRIDSLVKKYQYEHKENVVDMSFLPEILPVSRGEIVALTGNSGSSGGPHLNF
jgi:murein DD-endopeptidase MepM/ murein hydrolase activator NlpD